ncbi:hypothetical protein HZ326_24998 [Fusarium oxysporum f. sp. albedinis]|nr:hypothetical protein HZ326_24998 [Fusarium oxysporum f. sp. albedinis]
MQSLVCQFTPRNTRIESLKKDRSDRSAQRTRPTPVDLLERLHGGKMLRVSAAVHRGEVPCETKLQF